jgi:prepilin peptidase CpaA
MLTLLCLSVLAGLLVVGSLTDIEFRRLPNWLTSAVAVLYGFFVMTSPTPIDWVSACVVAGLVFGFGFATFIFQLLGGGDVKLMSGLALWAGPDHLALFLIVTSLAGGCLAILTIAIRQTDLPQLAWVYSPISRLIQSKLGSPKTASSDPSSSELDQPIFAGSLPYGVAIAAGGFAVIYALQQL